MTFKQPEKPPRGSWAPLGHFSFRVLGSLYSSPHPCLAQLRPTSPELGAGPQREEALPPPTCALESGSPQTAPKIQGIPAPTP